MAQTNNRSPSQGEVLVQQHGDQGGVLAFNDLTSFAAAVRDQTGLTLDFPSVVEVPGHFLENSDQYLIMNVKDDEGEDANNLLFLSEEKALLYSKRPSSAESYKSFGAVLTKPFGRSTILAYLTLHKVLDGYKARLDARNKEINELNLAFDYGKYREVAAHFGRIEDRLEGLHDLLLRLEESSVRQVETDYISFDYSVLKAESTSLVDRCRRRLNVLRDVARDHEMQAAMQLNLRLERLNDVVKRLTAITVILMIPTLIASHFGMNFAYMPELHIRWVYPAVVIIQFAFMGLALVIFKRTGWL
jgi:hypothetical protein